MIVYCLSEMGLKKQCVGSGIGSGHAEVRYVFFEAAPVAAVTMAGAGDDV